MSHDGWHLRYLRPEEAGLLLAGTRGDWTPVVRLAHVEARRRLRARQARRDRMLLLAAGLALLCVGCALLAWRAFEMWGAK
jgi:hypothetical protein